MVASLRCGLYTAVFLFAVALPPLHIPDCFRASARADFSYPGGLLLTRLSVIHADLRAGDFRQDVFGADPSTGADLPRLYTSVFRESTRELVLAASHTEFYDRSASPALCTAIPHTTGFAELLRGALPEYVGLAEVEAAVAAVDSALEVDAEVLLLHEWVIPRVNLTLFADLDGGDSEDGRWRVLIVKDTQHRVVYTVIELHEGCDVIDAAPISRERGSTGSPRPAASKRDLLFNMEHTTPLRCEPLG